MKRVAWLSIGVGFLLLVLVGMLSGQDNRELAANSFGNTPVGHGALFMLLRESGYDVERSYAPPGLLPERATVWWVAPDGLCAESGEDSIPDDLASDELTAWVARGGTALLALPAHELRCPALASIAGFHAPLRTGDQIVDRGPYDIESLDLERESFEREWDEDPTSQSVQGPSSAAPRTIEGVRLASFEEALDWEVAAELDGAPFVITRALGSGRIVLVADVGFMQNRALGRADASLLAHDLVVTYGVPWFDERAHGLRTTPGTLRYLASSSAMPFFLAMAALAALVFWSGAALPRRSLADAEPASPSLDAFVVSLAGLYAGTGDHAQVLERYRELCEARVRRALRLPVTTTREQLHARLRSAGNTGMELLRSLGDPQPVRGRSDLHRRAEALDAAVLGFIE